MVKLMLVNLTTRMTLRELLCGANFANTIMPWGQPGPIRLPDDPADRDQLIGAHLRGEPAAVLYAPADKPERAVHVERLQLAGLTPGTDGCCRWVAFDLDAATHGENGLLDPDAAARCVAERCHELGLGDGVLVVASRSGVGRHVWLLLGEPVPLTDAALLVAYIGACARLVANRDHDDHGQPHAFRSGAGVASPGQAGAVELIPRSETRPRLGYALSMAFAGGGQALDVFEDPPRPTTLRAVPQCNGAALARVIGEAHRALRARQPAQRRSIRPTRTTTGGQLDPRTVDLLAGVAPVGRRNRALYYAAGDMVHAGHTAGEVERQLLAAADRCGLPTHEARATIRSGLRRGGRR